MLADRFLHAGPDPRGRRYARWLRATGGEMEQTDWHDELRCLGLLLHEAGDALLMLMNAAYEGCSFRLPGGATRRWRRLVDTEAGLAEPDPEEHFAAEAVDLPARALVLLETRFHG
jgi:glycogen operon protein